MLHHGAKQDVKRQSNSNSKHDTNQLQSSDSVENQLESSNSVKDHVSSTQKSCKNVVHNSKSDQPISVNQSVKSQNNSEPRNLQQIQSGSSNVKTVECNAGPSHTHNTQHDVNVKSNSSPAQCHYSDSCQNQNSNDKSNSINQEPIQPVITNQSSDSCQDQASLDQCHSNKSVKCHQDSSIIQNNSQGDNPNSAIHVSHSHATVQEISHAHSDMGASNKADNAGSAIQSTQQGITDSSVSSMTSDMNDSKQNSDMSNSQTKSQSFSDNANGLPSDLDNYIKIKAVNNVIDIKLHHRSSQALMDSGARLSCLSYNLLRASGSSMVLNRSKYKYITGVGTEKHRVLGTITIPFSIHGQIFIHTFEVLAVCSYPMILGNDFMLDNDTIFRPHKGVVYLLKPDAKPKRNKMFSYDNEYHGLAHTINAVTFQPGQELQFQVSISNSDHNCNVNLEPLPSLLYRHSISGSNTLNTVQNGYGFYIARNDSMDTVTLKPKTPVAKVAYVITDSIINATDVIEQSNNGDGLSVNTLSTDNPDSSIPVNTVTNQSHDSNVISDSPIGESMATQSSTLPSNHMTKAEKINIAKSLNFDLSKSVMNDNEKQEFLAFLGEHKNIFKSDFSEMGLANVPPHEIQLKEGAIPKIQKPFPLTPEKRREVCRQVTSMLKGKIVRPIEDSKWQNPVCLARKPNNKWRFTIDMRYPNANIEPQNCVIPTAQEVFDTIADSKATIFSTLDMTSSFWQIPLDSKSQEITSFGTPMGTFAFTRLPFGMRNSTTVFMNTMHKLLKKSNFLYTLCYVDDLIAYSKDLSTHKLHLSQLFQVLSSAGFTLNPEKCHFCCDTVTYLGYNISSRGLSMTPEFQNAVKLYPQPENLKSLRGWLGLCNYYRRWCKGYSKIAAPLYSLLKKDVKFNFNQECVSAFNKMKKAMLTAPTLAHADFTRPFILTTDSSGTAIGYILGQLDKETKKEHPIAYGGRSLKAAERKWGITDREGLAVLEGIRAYKPYLQCNEFEIHTDHHALTFIKKLKNPNYNGESRLLRWSLDYNHIISPWYTKKAKI